MFGGQHRSDEATQAERVGWTRISDRRRKKIPLATGRSCASARVCSIAKAKDSKRQRKMKKTLDNGRPRYRCPVYQDLRKLPLQVDLKFGVHREKSLTINVRS